MKCKAVRCIYYNAGNGYTVASYVTEENLPKEVSSQKNGRYGMWQLEMNFPQRMALK
mgnify:CR=1 FL=1